MHASWLKIKGKDRIGLKDEARNWAMMGGRLEGWHNTKILMTKRLIKKEQLQHEIKQGRNVEAVIRICYSYLEKESINIE